MRKVPRCSAQKSAALNDCAKDAGVFPANDADCYLCSLGTGVAHPKGVTEDKKLKSGSGALALRKVDHDMKNQLKKLAIALIGLPLLALILLDPATVRTNAAAEDFDPAAAFKAKCAMCHGAKAEKKFDAAKADDQLVETVLKGKEGTPKMPAYEKSFSPEQAKALVAYMKSLNQ